MNSSILNLLNEIDKIRKYIDLNKKEVDFFSDKNNAKYFPHINIDRNILLIERQFHYTTIIITLYGAFEQFINNLIEEYILGINSIVKSYSSLPAQIQKNNYKLSIDLINKIEKKNYNGGLNREIVISNLSSCYSGNSYKLTPEAFSNSSANRRINVINDLLNQLGFTNVEKKIVKDKRFSLLCSELSKDSNYVINFINDLADRRNELAHGISVNTLSREIITEYIHTVEIYSKILKDILEQELISFTINEKGIEIGQPLEVFQKGKIIVINSQFNLIKLNQKIAAKNNNKLHIGKIIGLQVNSKDKKFITKAKNQQVGIKTDFNGKKGMTYYLIS